MLVFTITRVMNLNDTNRDLYNPTMKVSLFSDCTHQIILIEIAEISLKNLVCNFFFDYPKCIQNVPLWYRMGLCVCFGSMNIFFMILDYLEIISEKFQTLKIRLENHVFIMKAGFCLKNSVFLPSRKLIEPSV